MASVDKTAKQLAIEKGIFRQRGVKRTSLKTVTSDERVASSASSSSLTSLPEDGKALRYLIVIDFESTCWPDATTERFIAQRAPHPQEIIEFPAVFVDLRLVVPVTLQPCGIFRERGLKPH